MRGPGSAFEVLVEAGESSASGFGLHPEAIEVYGEDWVLPHPDQGLYRFSMFVMSHDGRVSFAVPGREGGGEVSDFNPHDQWLMGLLRARADAVMVGANTLRLESEHVWTPDFIYPADANLFAQIRRSEGRHETPLHVMLTRAGDVPDHAAIFDRQHLRVIIATTREGAVLARSRVPSHVQVLAVGSDDLDLDELHHILREEHQVHTVLSEGGPRVYAELVRAGHVDEEFLTISPVVIGSSDSSPRPGLIEGWALEPGNPARSTLVSLRRAGDHLFLRTRWNRG